MATPETEAAVDADTKLLSEVQQEGYVLRLESLHDGMECRASIKVSDMEKSIPPSELIQLLNSLNISESVQLEQVALFCTEAAEGRNPDNFLLARGKNPVPGRDGWFELVVNTGRDKPQFEEDEQGQVDFKAVQTFTNIEAGQLVGLIHPPQPGTAGLTVTGLPAPAPMGKPFKITAGDGIRITADSGEVFAEKGGRVIQDNDRLSIAEEFVVSGDVDLSVGNIRFNGFVEIKGDVLDDFHIFASKGISISGAVGACQIESDGPVTIGSMAGRETGLIQCRGTLQARYLNQANVECYGDVVISHEIRNSSVKSTGSIQVASGSISGGQAVALEGIEAKTLGATSGIRTSLKAGVYFPEEDRLQSLRSQLKSSVYQLKRIGETLGLLNHKNLDDLRPALREATELRMSILSQRNEALAETREYLAEELSSFKPGKHPTANPKINALAALKEGAMIHLGETSLEIKEERRGPLTIIENRVQGGLRFLSHSPLKVSAKQLEDEAQATETEDPATKTTEA